MITTDRLILRDFRLTDWLAVHEFCSDPEVMRFMLAGEPWTEARSRAYVEEAIAGAERHPRRNFWLAIVQRSDDRVIGSCRLSLLDEISREADVGYGLHRAFWKRGYGTEALSGLLRLGFGELGLHRISAVVVAANTASVRTLERVGMCREGQLREKYWLEGKWWDAYLYALLEHEWRAKHRSQP